ncbi:hypothetical protein [Ruegeria denitrificans]|uniref:hypothetical protein n=1 Tax=Ruegeria denitrificans TaxID=1715692 RepID=UPI00071C870D|nr:hypothetical protein [Ruegeria denitrificans]
MANIIFHIGCPKTGTTSIQNFLFQNAEWLNENGIYYPKPIFGSNHVVEMLQIAKTVEPNATLPWTDRWDDLATTERARLPIFVDSINKARDASLDSIISHEGFFNVLHTRDHIEWLAESFGRENVKAVLYVRRIDQWIEASISQRSKGTEPCSEDMIRRVLDKKLGDYDLIEQRLDIWSEIFGVQNVIVRPFERKSFAGGDVIADFADTLGLSKLAGLFDEKRETFEARNLSPNVESIRLWPHFLSYPVSQRSEFEKKIQELLSSKQLLDKLGSPRTSFLSFEERTSLVNRYSGMYARIAEKFLGRTTFFANDVPQGSDWPALTQADNERTLKIMHDYLVDSLNKEGTDAKVLLSDRTSCDSAVPVSESSSPTWRDYLGRLFAR